jgi:7-cyano-7-deazaguanine reductase
MASPDNPEINYRIERPRTVRRDVLRPLAYEYHERRGAQITIEQPEFTSVCPMTGLPDYGCLRIRYRPQRLIIELKSLKFYLLQYRNVGIFYEHLVNRVLDDLVDVLDPLWMEVNGAFSARGGITTSVSVTHPQAQAGSSKATL